MRQAVEAADRERAAWPLAGRALVSGKPVVIDRIRPGELEGIVNPAMDAYLGRFGMSAMAFVPMRGEKGVDRASSAWAAGPAARRTRPRRSRPRSGSPTAPRTRASPGAC